MPARRNGQRATESTSSGRRTAKGMQARILPLAEVDARVEASWRALAERAVEPNPYFEPEPVLSAARLMARPGAVAVLLVERAGEVHFALPVARRRVLHHVPVPALVTWLHPHSYLGTPLVDAVDPTAAWEAALSLLSRTRPAPRAAFGILPTDGPVRAALDEVSARRGASVTVLDPTPRAVLARRATESYLDGRLSARHRKQLRRQRRNLSQQLGAEVTVVDRALPGGDLAAGVGTFLRLEASGWKGTAGGALVSLPAHAEWFRQLCAGFHRHGRLRLLSLVAGGRDVAMACVVVAGDIAFHVKVAFDETYRRCSPGMQLELELISEFHRDIGLQWIDSCSDGEDSLSAQLYPDRRTVGTALLPLYGPHGRASSRYTPAVLAVGRRVKYLARPASALGADSSGSPQ